MRGYTLHRQSPCSTSGRSIDKGMLCAHHFNAQNSRRACARRSVTVTAQQEKQPVKVVVLSNSPPNSPSPQRQDITVIPIVLPDSQITSESENGFAAPTYNNPISKLWGSTAPRYRIAVGTALAFVLCQMVGQMFTPDLSLLTRDLALIEKTGTVKQHQTRCFAGQHTRMTIFQAHLLLHTHASLAPTRQPYFVKTSSTSINVCADHATDQTKPPKVKHVFSVETTRPEVYFLSLTVSEHTCAS